MTEQAYPTHPFNIRRNGKICARASNQLEAQKIIRQLRKIHPNSAFTVTYEGANISHCGEGETAL